MNTYFLNVLEFGNIISKCPIYKNSKSENIIKIIRPKYDILDYSTSSIFSNLEFLQKSNMIFSKLQVPKIFVEFTRNIFTIYVLSEFLQLYVQHFNLQQHYIIDIGNSTVLLYSTKELQIAQYECRILQIQYLIYAVSCPKNLQ